MRRDEKVAYMANVLSIASVDGGISDNEAKLLRHIARKLDVNQEILDDAKRLIGSGAYRLNLPAMPVDRMSNVEDMVMIALADGEVKASEAAPIEKMAGVLKLAQADVDMLVARARSRLHKLGQEKTAPKRHTPKAVSKPAPPPPLPAEQKPKPPPTPRQKAKSPRRKPVREVKPPEPRPAPRAERAKPEPPPRPPTAPKAEKTKPEPPPEPKEPVAPSPPTWQAGPGVTIAFSGEGEAVDTCIELALAAPESGHHEQGDATWHHATWPGEQLAAAVSLAMKVALLANRKVHIDGGERNWDEIFGFCSCALGRKDSKHPVEYCFGNETVGINPCGCRLLAFDWGESAEWLTKGMFESNHRYRLDKAALRQLLDKGLERVRFCPYLKPELARAMLEALPDAIHAWGAWSHREAAPESREAQTVSVRESLHGCTVTASKRVDGIAPTSARGAIRLIKAAARKCGVREPDYSLLYRRGRENLRK